MATFTTFYILPEDIAEKIHNFASDSFKVMLTNSAPSLSNTIKSNITEISAGNGYSAGGAALTISSSGQSSGLYKWIIADVTITASGGSIGPFRYAVIYNDTPTANSQGANADPLVGYLDYGSSITLADGQSTTLDFSAANGVLQIQ